MSKIYCITDPAARVAAVIERRPQKWWRLGRWDLASGAYEEGAWFRGTLYPQRCDLSRGGRWFSYFALKPNSDWPAGETYNAISRLPWLKALAAWKESGTWSRGIHFVENPTDGQLYNATVGDATPCTSVCGIVDAEPAQFAVERRRGWRESAATPTRDPNDLWDENRDVVMEKPSPVNPKAILSVRGKFQAFRGLADHWPPDYYAYILTRNGKPKVLPGIQWADWTFDGHLAQATESGQLSILDIRGKRIISVMRLGEDGPKQRKAPLWAEEW